MIFLSHNYKDKPVVEQFAGRLKTAVGQDNVFYDSWSIQPGDGIVDKMNEGILNCKIFFFFVSANSLASGMVKLEWQNALIKATQCTIKLIPVKLDECMMPPILMQSLYIDLWGQGIEIALRQMMDVVSGTNTFIPELVEFNNLNLYLSGSDQGIIVECRVKYYMEPVTKFIYLIDNKSNEVSFECLSNTSFMSGFNENVKLDDGRICNGQLMAIERATTPGHPFMVKINKLTDVKIKLIGVLHEKSMNKWIAVRPGL